jgi:hypothetical protein
MGLECYGKRSLNGVVVLCAIMDPVPDWREKFFSDLPNNPNALHLVRAGTLLSKHINLQNLSLPSAYVVTINRGHVVGEVTGAFLYEPDTRFEAAKYMEMIRPALDPLGGMPA